jgi:integrase
MKMKLTKKAVDGLKAPPAGKRLLVYDTELPGFLLVVHPTGIKAFFVEWGPERRRRRVTLGRYPVLAVDDARGQAKLKLAAVVKGGDPVADRRQERNALTFSEWVDDYMKGVEQRKKSAREDRRYLGMAKKLWVGKRLDAITPDDVERAFRAVSVGHKTRGNRFLASVRACFQAAWRVSLVANNPAMKVRLNREGTPRARVLSDPEMKRLLVAIDALKDPFVKAAFLLLIETGARRSEVLRAKWEDFDLKAGNWRIPSPKAGHPQVVPLPGNVVVLLEHLPRVGSLVIPGTRNPDKPRFDLAGPWTGLRIAAKLKDVRLHDLRRTFGLQVARAAGVHVASKLLRHSDIRVTEQVYAPLGLNDLRRAVEQHSGKLAKVLPITQGRRKAS